jgi:anthranilate synthase component 1
MKKIPRIALGKKPTYTKIAEDVDLFSLFQKVERAHENCFLFESLGEEGTFSRYSIIGFDPKHHIEGTRKTLRVDTQSYTTKNPYYALRSLMPEKTISRNYAGGLVGYIGYEATHFFEPTVPTKDHPDFPLFQFGAYDDGLVHDKTTNELFYFFYERDRRKHVEHLLTTSHTVQPLSITCNGDELTQAEHRAIVDRVQEHIRAGNTFQCEVGLKTKYTITGDTLRIYERLRTVNPSPFMYFMKFGKRQIIGASPELLFSLRDGEMTTRPLAGTIRRGSNKQEDQRLARTLLNDPKERAEHVMLVDLHRNDIGRVAQFGTVRVRELMRVVTFSHVQHLSSEVVGIIKPTEDMFSGLASNFPMGTICGTPKVETLKIINENEREARGPYGGGVGHFGFNGDCTFALALRSVFLAEDRGYAQTCSGIVYDSEPDHEYEEIVRKLAAMKHTLMTPFT